jgi:hypothetical protein
VSWAYAAGKIPKRVYLSAYFFLYVKKRKNGRALLVWMVPLHSGKGLKMKKNKEENAEKCTGGILRGKDKKARQKKDGKGKWKAA